MHDPTAFERYIIELTGRLAALPGAEVDEAIEAVLLEVGESLGTDRATFLEGTPDVADLVATHAWARAGYPPAATGQSLRGELPWYVAALLRGQTIALAHVADDLPAEAPAERAFARGAGLRSSLTVPVAIGGRFTCALATHTFRHHCVWSDPLVGRFRLVAQILALAIARRRADHEVERAARPTVLRPMIRVERDHILAVLEARRWRINGRGNTADVLELHPNTLRSRMKKLGIRRPARPRRRA